MKRWMTRLAFAAALLLALWAGAEDNALTEDEERDGWVLLFDGAGVGDWLTDDGPADASCVEEGAINPHKAPGKWVYHKDAFGDFVFSCDFKISPGANSGIFFRVGDPKDVVQTGIELQVLDTAGKESPGVNDGGAVYDVLAPAKNAMKPAGEWNHVEITAKGSRVEVVLNGERVIDMDLDRWTEPGKNPDGTKNKFRTAYRDMPRKGHIGFQDHGDNVWFKNVKVKPLEE